MFDQKYNQLKIGDYGITNIFDKQQLDACMRDFKIDITPEEIKGDGYSLESDIWQLGVLLYQLCTLEHPFCNKISERKGINLVEQANKILKAQFKDIPSNIFSSNMNKLISLMLTPKKSTRLSINEVLNSDLFRQRKFDETTPTFSSTIGFDLHWEVENKQKKNLKDDNQFLRLPKKLEAPRERRAYHSP